MAASSIGLHIGVDTAEGVVLSGSFHSPRLVNWGKIPIPPGPWRSQFQAKEMEPVTEPSKETAAGATGEEVSAAISGLLKTMNLTSVQPYVAAAAESVIIRYFQMPMIPAHERRMAISYEAKKYLPFKVEDLITDFHVVTYRSDPALMRVMFFGIKKNVSMTYQLLLKAAGLTPLCLEPPPVSLMRLTRQSGQLSAGQVCVVLSVEQTNATISIAKEDLLYLSRNVMVGVPGQTDPQPSMELMEALVSETRVSIDYYRRRFLGEPVIQKVVLFGSDVSQNQVNELSRALELPVEPGEPFRRIGVGKEVPGGLAVATGLALRGLEKKPGQPNLLPIELRRQPRGILKPLLVSSSIALGLLCAAFLAQWWDLNAQQQKVASVQQQQVFPPGVTSAMSVQELLRFRTEKQRQIQFLKELSSGPPEKPSLLLSHMTTLLPPEIWLEQIFLTDTLKTEGQSPGLEAKRRGAILLQGYAYADHRDQELQLINDFLSQMKGSALLSSSFAEMSLGSVERSRYYEELEVTEFSLSAATNREDLAELSQRSKAAGSTRRYLP